MSRPPRKKRSFRAWASQSARATPSLAQPVSGQRVLFRPAAPGSPCLIHPWTCFSASASVNTQASLQSRTTLTGLRSRYIQDFKNYWLQRLKSGLFSVITVLWLWCYVNRPATPAHILNGLQSISLMMTKWPIDSFFAIFCPCIILVCLFLDFPFMLSSRCLDKSFAQ